MTTEVSANVDFFSGKQIPSLTVLKLVEHTSLIQRNIKLYQKLLLDFTDMVGQLEDMPAMTISFDYTTYQPCMNVSWAGDGDSLRHVWGLLRQNGYEPTERPKKGDTQFHAYFLNKPNPHVWINFASTECRRVQVGTQTVEQPVYETRCVEMPELDAPNTLPAINLGP